MPPARTTFGNNLKFELIEKMMVSTDDTEVIVCTKDHEEDVVRQMNDGHEKHLFVLLRGNDYTSVLYVDKASNVSPQLIDDGGEDDARSELTKNFPSLSANLPVLSTFKVLKGKDSSVMHNILYEYYSQTGDDVEDDVRDEVMESYGELADTVKTELANLYEGTSKIYKE